jgi:hypothetical protein
MSKADRKTLGIPSKTLETLIEGEQTPESSAPEAPEASGTPAAPAAHVAPTPNPRAEALARLAAQADVETGNAEAVEFSEQTHLERPIGDDGLPEDPAVPMLVAPPGDDEGQGGAAAAVPPTEGQPAPAAPAAKKFQVEVKGHVAEVDEQAVIEAGLHALRHKGAAEMALREANILLTQARGIAAPAAPEQPQGQAPASTPDDALRLAEALQFGTKEDAAKAVAAMMNRGVASADINDVVARTVETRVRDVLDQDAAAKQLEQIVPELKTDKWVLVLLANEERAARMAGDSRPYSQLYPEIGNKVRTWLDSLKAPAQAPAAKPAAPAIAQRQAAKAAVPQPVSGRGAAPAAPAQPKPPTGSEIVAQMRAMRGQRQAI